MMNQKIRGFLSIYLVIILMTMGLIGILIFDVNQNNSNVSAKTIVVDKDGNGDYKKIQTAINQASPGDIIRVWAGTYYENVLVNKTLTLIGNGTGDTYINGSRTSDVVRITADWVNFTGFTVTYSGNDSIWWSDDSGIELIYVNNAHIYDVNCSFNLYGIFINHSTHSIIENNTIWKNEVTGIILHTSNYNVITNNIIDNITHSYSAYGLTMGFSDFNKITNNIISESNNYGFTLYDCHQNKIKNNTIARHNWYGMEIYESENNTFESNKIMYNNYVGLEMYDSGNNTFIDNKFQYNNWGVEIWDSNNNEFLYNNISWNFWYGFYISYSSNQKIYNNSFFNNSIGLYLEWNTQYNKINNNTFEKNSQNGIQLTYSNFNDISNNTILRNNNGISISDSSRMNIISNNNISNNIRTGMDLTWNSMDNLFIENLISFNSNIGISIDSTSNSNDIYHNLIISNSQQASDIGNNNWDYNGEGNYWSDYTGVDDGSNGRIAGDGIGDTKIPHPSSGMDNYPFLKPYGWLYPAVPFLTVESNLNSDGNFTVSWGNNSRSDGYIFQEDRDPSFNSPTVYTTGWILEGNLNVLYFDEQEEGTYYYRAKSYNALEETDWSQVVNVTVDFPPRVPKKLNVSPIPEGNGLHITWDANSEDTIIYGLYFYNILNWELLINLSHSTNYFDHYGLEDDKEYAYKICAYDSINQTSGFSKIAKGVPKDTMPPTAPTGLTAEAISDSEIQLEWDANTEADLAGYSIFMYDPVKSTSEEYFYVYTIYGEKTTYKKTELSEQVTYKFKILAFDEVPNNSTLSEPVSAATPDETHPLPPTGLKVSNATSDSLTIYWEASLDEDVIGYFIYRSTSLTGEYTQITPEPISIYKYQDTGLDENTFYYYKIKSIDDANLASLFSDSAYGITKIGPRPPEINNSLEDFEMKEDTIDDISINLYYLFKDVNSDPLIFWIEDSKNIQITIYQENGTVVIIPNKDWNGDETLTFYASDDITEISYDITITVTYMNDPPGEAKIIEPANDTLIKEGDSLDFQGTCSDPDLSYGDILKYKWKSSIDGKLGTGENLTGIELSNGEHVITLEVKDQFGRTSTASINVDVALKSIDKTSDDGGWSNLAVIGLIVVFIILILLVLIFMFLKKKKAKPTDDEKDDEGVESMPGAEQLGAGFGQQTQDGQLMQAPMPYLQPIMYYPTPQQQPAIQPAQAQAEQPTQELLTGQPPDSKLALPPTGVVEDKPSNLKQQQGTQTPTQTQAPPSDED